MTPDLRRRAILLLCGAVVFSGLAVATGYVQKYRYRPYLHEKLYLPSGKFVEQISLGYREVAADMVWLQAVQYYGDFRKGNHDLKYFRGLIDITTTLDPHFIFAYVFGALVVSEDVGSFEEGMEILKEGISRNPQSWQLPFEIAFLNFINRRDPQLAGRYFELASRMPGAPEYTKRFAAFVYSRAGDSDSSIRLWEEYMEHTENPFLKELAERYIEKLKASRVEQKAPSDAS
jgi:tetratricopeptide (TPR) repeat protein